MNMPEIRINGRDTAFEDWGLRMGDDFLNILTEPLSLKSPIENTSRLEHGKRVVLADVPKVASRDITLSFTIEGDTPEDFIKKKNDFFAEMYKGYVDIQIPQLGNEIYHLIYTGYSADYGMNTQRTFCHFVLKFTEPNPMNRQ